MALPQTLGGHSVLLPALPGDGGRTLKPRPLFHAPTYLLRAVGSGPGACTGIRGEGTTALFGRDDASPFSADERSGGASDECAGVGVPTLFGCDDASTLLVDESSGGVSEASGGCAGGASATRTTGGSVAGGRLSTSAGGGSGAVSMTAAATRIRAALMLPRRISRISRWRQSSAMAAASVAAFRRIGAVVPPARFRAARSARLAARNALFAGFVPGGFGGVGGTRFLLPS
jgi:hypothetical protein